ncbi:hypothetical protein [Micromonospora parathelypteridis]|uniref:Uncharacterized protein n=1 Tax=Micromonospora parathelypteridis TaxID=1839617 RepID=A0A840VWE8_9ACTN|nr:hypothetical protein [Micromonospora parathelypteridis]MBB5480947.1 hypothetical protein [Micromonospora parathelypteridis]GGO20839.1 hypothetical protein GCM10011576_38540 [Micromonospora parathelypteridis]
MRDDLEQIEAAFVGTPLAGLPIGHGPAGTVLVQVGRRPTPGDEAWTVAGQLKALAPNLELSQWEVAVALPAGDAWFVHNRP